MRIRTIKPEFFTHVGIFEAEQESKLPLRLAFIGLWCAADREGRFRWEPRRLGVQIMPYDKADFSRVLDALNTRGFIVRYASGNHIFGAIPSFPRHQVINNRERDSLIPAPSESTTSTRDPRVPDACPTPLVHAQVEGKGMEGNMEGKGTDLFAPDGTSSDPLRAEISWDAQNGFAGITDSDRAAWSEAYPAVDIKRAIAAASEWLKSNPAKRKKQHRRFLTAWLSRQQERGGDIPSNRAPAPAPKLKKLDWE